MVDKKLKNQLGVKLAHSLVISSSHYTWQERNNCAFKNQTSTKQQVLEACIYLSQGRLMFVSQMYEGGTKENHL